MDRNLSSVADIREMEDLVFSQVVATDDLLVFQNDAVRYRFYHDQDCCESVYIEDIIGDLDDLVGSPILQAEEVSYSKDDEYAPLSDSHEDFLWTFYKFSTIKGSVTIRWYGSSNGYYSVSVNVSKENLRQSNPFLGKKVSRRKNK